MRIVNFAANGPHRPPTLGTVHRHRARHRRRDPPPKTISFHGDRLQLIALAVLEDTPFAHKIAHVITTGHSPSLLSTLLREALRS